MSKASAILLALHKKPLRKYVINNIWLYIFLAIGLVYFIVFNFVPMYGVIIAFMDFIPSSGFAGSKWVGLKHFADLFTSKDFYTVFGNSVAISLFRILWGFPAPIFLALMLNEVQNKLFKRSVQTIVYIPHFISWVVMASIMINFLSPSNGLFNEVIKYFGGNPIPFLSDPAWFRSSLIFTEIYKEVGWGTIIYLAAMSGIDPNLYEAAIIDGAGRTKCIRHVTLPSILPTIMVLLVLRMGSVLRNGFEQIYLLYNPLVYSVADVFETYTYRSGILMGRFSYATAVGLFQSVVGLAFILISNRLSYKLTESKLW